MTEQELLARINAMEPQALDPEYTGSCPCFRATVAIDGHALRIRGACWRVSKSDGEYQDLELESDSGLQLAVMRRIGAALKRQLDAQEWYMPYQVYYSRAVAGK